MSLNVQWKSIKCCCHEETSTLSFLKVFELADVITTYGDYLACLQLKCIYYGGWILQGRLRIACYNMCLLFLRVLGRRDWLKSLHSQLQDISHREICQQSLFLVSKIYVISMPILKELKNNFWNLKMAQTGFLKKTYKILEYKSWF